MKPPCSAVLSLLVMFILLSSVQGIRLEKSFKSAGHPKLDEGALMKNSNGVMGDVILCKEGHCTGKGRKLFSATTASSPASTATSKLQDEKNGENKANLTSKLKSAGNEENGGKQEKFPVGSPTTSEHQDIHDQYADIMDIVEMDYSSAQRKPPIHN